MQQFIYLQSDNQIIERLGKVIASVSNNVTDQTQDPFWRGSQTLYHNDMQEILVCNNWLVSLIVEECVLYDIFSNACSNNSGQRTVWDGLLMYVHHAVNNSISPLRTFKY